MARPSSIDRLEPEVRETIGRLREQGRTIDEILVHLRTLDVDVSRSALGRHTQDLDRIAERMRYSRSIAEGLEKQFGEDEGAGKVMRLNISFLEEMMFEVLTKADVELTGADVKRFASGMLDLARARKIDTDREIKVKNEVAGKVEAIEKEALAAGEKGVPLERLAELRREFLGVRG